jgi:hypothetical protein
MVLKCPTFINKQYRFSFKEKLFRLPKKVIKRLLTEEQQKSAKWSVGVIRQFIAIGV